MAYTTIDNPELYFQAKIYTGTGSENVITLDGDTDMQPDLVWIKCRSDADNHPLHDSIRGATNVVHPDTADAEYAVAEGLKSFDSDGFTLGTSNFANQSSRTFVAWCWKESATAGFDIISFTGNATARTISHNLSAIPKMIIVKTRSTNDYNWIVYHGANTSAPETDAIFLNTDDDTDDDATYWNDTAPTSSVFTVGTSGYSNKNTDNMLAYAFADVQGFSKFGSYVGNGSTDGPFIYTGFRPAWFMIKYTGGSSNWTIFDNKRDGYNEITKSIDANVSNAEDTDAAYNDVDFCSNGIKITEDNGDLNGSGNNIIYAAFAEAPFVNSNGVPNNAR